MLGGVVVVGVLELHRAVGVVVVVVRMFVHRRVVVGHDVARSVFGEHMIDGRAVRRLVRRVAFGVDPGVGAVDILTSDKSRR